MVEKSADDQTLDKEDFLPIVGNLGPPRPLVFELGTCIDLLRCTLFPLPSVLIAGLRAAGGKYSLSKYSSSDLTFESARSSDNFDFFF